MRWTACAVFTAALASLLTGCGGDGTLSPAPGPEPPGGDVGQTLEVGPMLVRPASTAGFTATAIDSEGTVSFAGLYGSQINYLAAQALMDRIVFSSYRDGYLDIWVCNLDGSGLVQLTNNTAHEGHPNWSPDGTRITFDRQWPGQDIEIMVMNADGSGVHALTNDGVDQRDPCWSPEGRRVAFQSMTPGNWDIYTMYDDGISAMNLTSHSASDQSPNWAPSLDDPDILFSSDRAGDAEIYRMDEDGTNVTALTANSWQDYRPAWRPDMSEIVWDADLPVGREIVLKKLAGGGLRNFSASSNDDSEPSWSSDGRWIAYSSLNIPNIDVYIQQTAPPYQRFRVTTLMAVDEAPDLGSPAMQVERVLIGPNGSDWGGADPVWSSAYAGVVAFASNGYLNFVRIGVASADADTIRMESLTNPGLMLAGVAVEAHKIVNLREDAGRDSEPTVWDLSSWNAGAVLLYFDAFTGKLASVLVARDVVYPSAANGPVAPSLRGDRLIVGGDFVAVLDEAGDLVAENVGVVELGADGRVAHAR